MKKRFTFPSLGRSAKIILHIELPLTLLFWVVFLISYLMARESDAWLATAYYAPLTVYLFYPFVITAFSVLLVERLEKGD